MIKINIHAINMPFSFYLKIKLNRSGYVTFYFDVSNVLHAWGK